MPQGAAPFLCSVGVRGKRDEVRGTRYESRGSVGESRGSVGVSRGAWVSGVMGVSLWGDEQWDGEVASGTSSVSETRDYG